MDKKKEGSKAKKIKIDKTISFKSILEYDSAGYILDFDIEIDKFLWIDKRDLDKLSSDNRTRYYMASGLNRALNDYNKYPETPKLKITPGYSTAATKQSIISTPEFDKKYHAVWKRADEVRACQRDGFMVVKPNEVESFMGPVAGGHIIGIEGDPESVLMKETWDIYNERQKRNTDESDRRDGSVQESAMSVMTSVGGNPFIPDK